jgi:hypothetical protein
MTRRVALLIVSLLAAGASGATDPLRWDFDRDAHGESPAGWEVLTGTWEVRPEAEDLPNQSLMQTGPSLPGMDLPMILAPPRPVRDLAAAVRFKRAGGPALETMALVLRWAAPDRLTLVTVEGTPGHLWVEQERDGVRRLLFGAVTPIAPDRWHRLEVSATGDLLTILLNGRVLGAAIDPAPIPGRVGLAAGPGAGVLLDDVVILPLPAAPVLGRGGAPGKTSAGPPARNG